MKESILIREVLEESEENDELIEIPLTMIRYPVLLGVIDFCFHHYNEKLKSKEIEKVEPEIPKPISNSVKLSEVLTEFDFNLFMKLTRLNIHTECYLASNYFNIPYMLIMMASGIGQIMKGKDYLEIREFLGTATDMTKEQEDIIKEENRPYEEVVE